MSITQNSLKKKFPLKFDQHPPLNKFFTSVFTQEDQERLPEFENRPCSSELTHLNITSEDVKQIFGKLKTSKSPGPDGLHPRVLVELRD